jgi:membrane fusion protein, multidrug efflux system
MILARTLRPLALAGTLGLVLISAACTQKTEGQQGADKPPVAVDAARAATADFQQSVEVVGTLSPKFSADVKSEYPGIVSQILVSEWVPVKKGQVLARLDAREPEAAVLQAKAEAARADREYERAVKLKEVGLMTTQGLEDTETIREAANAQLALAKARLDKTVIRAPMDGTISMRAVSPGDKAGDATLFRVVDNAAFDLKVSVPSGRISAVQVGQPLDFSTEAVPGRTFEGKVAFINPAADEASRAVGVVVEVPNEDGALRSGLFVKGRIVTGARQGVLQIPKSALLTWDLESQKAECFVVQGDKALRRAVTTGAVEGESVEITSGLGAGDTVVTRGGFNLSDGDRVAVGGETQDARR